VTAIYRIKVKTQHYEVEVESNEKEFVVQKLEEHLRTFGRESATPQSSIPPVTTTTVEGYKELSLQEFINQVEPSSGPEYVLAIGYFLEKHQSLKNFTSAQIKAEFQRAKFQHPNPTDALLKARGAGKVMDGPEKGTYVLTRTGEQWVQTKLAVRAKQ
jgi:hypothetical protein